MMEDLLSVIVPVYNVEPYLERSIQSIINQSYRNIELILVDDGSTDGSGEICKKYAKLDSRIKLIVQENQGAASARRQGVRAASGKYMSFVDPDDYVDEDLYQQLMECRDDFDLVIAQWFRESDQGVRRAYDTIRPGAYRTQEDMDFLIRHLINVSLPGGEVNIRPGIAAYLWNKLFKTELVKNVVEEISIDLPVSNDRPIIYGVLLNCRSVLITEICGYHYWVRRNSIAHALDQHCKYINSICDFYNMMECFFQEDPRHDILMPQLQLKTAEELTRATVKMSFTPEAQLKLHTPIFPYLNLLDNKEIALYGAGYLGCGYKRQISKWNICKIKLWVDENWEEYSRAGMEVVSMDELLTPSYDFIILALADQASADIVKNKLVSMGIEQELILWKPPLEI